MVTIPFGREWMKWTNEVMIDDYMSKFETLKVSMVVCKF